MSLIKYRVIARHKWVSDCTITELVSDCDRYRKFVATISGWRGFELYCGVPYPELVQEIIKKVKEIRERIKIDDKSFYQDCHI